MDCIDDDGPPPAPLVLSWQCDRWHIMPESGGLYDQDYQTMTQMTACLNIYQAVSRLRSLHGKQIHSLTDGERKILGGLVRMGLLFNG